MWEALRDVARREGRTINDLVTGIDEARVESSLTAAIRVYLLTYYQGAATEEGHLKAGHGKD